MSIGKTNGPLDFRGLHVSSFPSIYAVATPLARPENMGLQLASARRELARLEDRLRQAPPLPNATTHLGRLLHKMNNPDDLRDRITNPADRQHFPTITLYTRIHGLRSAIAAHDENLANFFIFDNGTVALSDGTRGETSKTNEAIVFRPFSLTKPMVYYTNDRTEKKLLQHILPLDSAQLVHNGKTYFFKMNAAGEIALLIDVNGQPYKLNTTGDTLSITEDTAGTTKQILPDVFQQGENYFYCDQNMIYPAKKIFVDSDDYYYVPHTNYGSLVIDAEGNATPLTRHNLLHATDTEGRELRILNNTVLTQTDDHKIWDSDTGLKCMIIAEPTKRPLLLEANISVTQIQFEDGSIVIKTFDQERNPLTYWQWPQGAKPLNAIWPKAQQENWTIITSSGHGVQARDVISGIGDFNKYQVSISPAELSKKELEIMIPCKKDGTWDIVTIDTKTLVDIQIDRQTHVLIGTQIFVFKEETQGSITLQLTHHPPSNTEIVCITAAQKKQSFILDRSNFNAALQIGIHHSNLNFIDHVLSDEGQWVPQKTIAANGRDWRVHRILNGTHGKRFAVVSHTDAKEFRHPPVELWCLQDNGEYKQIQDGFFQMSCPEGSIELFVSTGRVWDVTSVSPKNTVLPCLGNRGEMQPEDFMAFKRKSDGTNLVVPLNIEEIREELRGHIATHQDYWLPDGRFRDLNYSDKAHPNKYIRLMERDHSFSQALKLSNGNDSFQTFTAQDWELNEADGPSWRYTLPSEDDPLVQEARRQGFYIPRPTEIMDFHNLLRQALPDIAVRRLKKIVFYPGKAIIHSRIADFDTFNGKMGIYGIKASNLTEWLQLIIGHNIFEHEINGHGRENLVKDYLHHMTLAMMLDGMTMVYGRTNSSEYNAVLAEYMGHCPEMANLFVNGAGVFYGQMLQDQQFLLPDGMDALVPPEFA